MGIWKSAAAVSMAFKLKSLTGEDLAKVDVRAFEPLGVPNMSDMAVDCSRTEGVAAMLF